MKTQRILALLLSATAWATLGLEAAHADSRRDPRCRTVRFILHTKVDFASFTATGTATGGLHGTVRFVGDATSVRPVEGEVLPSTRPALSYTGELTLRTPTGSLTTRNVGVFEPGPFGSGVEFGTIIGGTGRFADSEGVLSFAVSGDAGGMKFVEFGFGRICRPVS